MVDLALWVLRKTDPFPIFTVRFTSVKPKDSYSRPGSVRRAAGAAQASPECWVKAVIPPIPVASNLMLGFKDDMHSNNNNDNDNDKNNNDEDNDNNNDMNE